MTDQITPGVRIGVPPTRSEIATASHRFVSLSAKLFLAIFLPAIILIAITLAATLLQIRIATYIFPVLFVAWAVCIYWVLMQFYVRPLQMLLAWFKQSREDGFKHVPPIPIGSADELGRLAQEMSTTISIIWQAGEHEQELLKHKSDTITLIEHQLRTALTSLKWSLENTEVPKEVSGAVTRVSDTVQEIINAARIGEGTFGYVFSEIDIIPIIQKLITSFQERADSRGVRIVFEHGTDIPHILADTDRISIALSNVLSNAVEYTPREGIVTVSITLVDDFVDITIKDTGVGMSQEDLANLFSKMHRGKIAMKMRPDGSGLGLYVAKNIFNEHGAEVMVQSEEGRGTQFSVRIHRVLAL